MSVVKKTIRPDLHLIIAASLISFKFMVKVRLALRYKDTLVNS